MLEIAEYLSGTAKVVADGVLWTRSRRFIANAQTRTRPGYSGPFLGLAWIDQEVKGYRESGRSSTSMDFSDFERDSLIARGGYQLTWSLGGGVRPYARVTYKRELKDDPILVTVGRRENFEPLTRK